MGKGKYRVRLIDTKGQEMILTTYESTVGAILWACENTGYCNAYRNEDGYINFISAGKEG